ncbi:MAG: cysteine desulfurase [Bacilli bacterium]|nr:cysteine desulfurase [Bacilli bacterium]
MIYLDYSATTPVHKDVLDTFCKVTNEFIGNPNSLHDLGSKSKDLIDAANKQIADILKVKESEIIYTSGSSESNNTVIKGICLKYPNRKHIITTKFEHSSIYGPIGYLQTLGYEVEFVDSDSNGLVNLEHLKSLLKKDTILVSIGAVNSEIGIIQPINEIGKTIKENSNAFFHSDITQIVGKKEIDLSNVDLASFSAHKFYGIKGIGGLIKKEGIDIIPLIHGGKSTTKYRSGTPTVALIASMAKALRLAYEKLGSYEQIRKFNEYLQKELVFNKNVKINSNEKCIAHILNLSVIGVKPESLLHALEKHEIYISTQTACSSTNSLSKSVLSLTNDEERAKSSIRISLSYNTTKEELDEFIKIFKNEVTKLLEVAHENN